MLFWSSFQILTWNQLHLACLGKMFIETHLLTQFVIDIEINISRRYFPTWIFFIVNFIYVSQSYVCRNKFKFKVERIPKFIFDNCDSWVIVKVLNFSVLSKQFWGMLLHLCFPNLLLILTKELLNVSEILESFPKTFNYYNSFSTRIIFSSL